MADQENRAAERILLPQAKDSASDEASAPPSALLEAEVLNDAFSTTEEWEANNERMDRPKMDATSRIAGDLAMPQAHMLGTRRNRPFTPSSSARPAKVARERACDDTARALQYQDQPSQDMLLEIAHSGRGQEAAPNQDAASSQEAAPTAADYDLWDLARYKRAKTMYARGQFWLLASEESKRRITADLLKDPPSTAAVVQAKQMKRIH